MSINSLNAQIRKTLNIFYLQLVDLFEERFYIHSLTVKFTAGLIDLNLEMNDEEGDNYRLTLSLDPNQVNDDGSFPVYLGNCTKKSMIPNNPRFYEDFAFYFVNFLTVLFNEDTGYLKGHDFSAVVYYPFSGRTRDIRYVRSDPNDPQSPIELRLGVNDLIQWGGSNLFSAWLPE